MTELTVDQALQKGVEAHKAGQVQEADRLYTAILKAQPKHPEANHNLGVLAVGIGKLEQALPFFKTALEANPATAQNWLSYIDTLIKLDKFADAKAVLDQAKSKGAKGDGFDKLEQRLKEASEEPLAVSKTPTEAPPQQPNILDSLKLDQAISLAKKKAKEGSPEEARYIYQDILTKFPKNRRASDGLDALARGPVGITPKVQEPPQGPQQSIINLYNQGQFLQALEQAEILMQQFPNSSFLYNVSGAAYKGLGKFDAAVKAYTKTIAIKPDYAEAHKNMGNVLLEQGKLEEAIEAYNKSLAIEPTNVDAYSNIAVILKNQGQLEKAISLCNIALSINPDYANAHHNLGNALLEKGEVEEAIKAFNKVLSLDPHFAYTLEILQSLSVQLTLNIKKYDFNFYNYEKIDQLIDRGPLWQIYGAIKAFLEEDFTSVQTKINAFKASSGKLLNTLDPKNKIFCIAFSNFLTNFLKEKMDEAFVPKAQKKLYHLGESHCLTFAHQNIEAEGENFKIVPQITFGAKAFHFSQDKNNKYKQITKINFLSLPQNSKVFISFGEIDCRPNEGFITAAEKLSETLDDLIDKTVAGYVQWFVKHNEKSNHRLYFFNVPAPVYNKEYRADVNFKVARAVDLFNKKLKECLLKNNLDLVDLFCFTAGNNGFSNELFHLDRHHLRPKAVLKIQKQIY